MNYTRQNDVTVENSLREAIWKMVLNIKNDPFRLHYVDVKSDGPEEPAIAGHEIFIDWYICNRIGPVITNMADIELCFHADEEMMKRFTGLQNFNLYTCEQFGDKSWECTVHCGEDPEMASYLFSEFIQKVWNAHENLTYQCYSMEFMNDVVGFELNLNYSSCLIQKIHQLIHQYNDYALQCNYPVIEITDEIIRGTLPGKKPAGSCLSKARRTHRSIEKRFNKLMKTISFK